MKKQGKLFLLLALFSLLMVGCSKKTFSIDDRKLTFEHIVVRDGNTGNAVTLDEKKSQEVYDMIKDIKFQEEKSSKGSTGWNYALDFVKEDQVTDTIIIKDETTIEYDDYYYKSEVASVDMDYISSLFDVSFHAVVMDNKQGLFVTPEMNTNEYRSSDKISVGINQTKIYDADNKEIGLEQLQIGDHIEIVYNGVIAESYPAQISANRIKILEPNLKVEGYLTAIHDIYEEDPALNHEITMIAFDFTDIEELKDEEKDQLLTKLKVKYDMEIRESTYEQLVEEGLIDKENLYFPKGIIITMEDTEFKENRNTLTYKIRKWRSGLGAIGYDGKARYTNGEWVITKENMWIS